MSHKISKNCAKSKEQEFAASLRSIGLPREPQRVVSLVPSITETLFAVGLGSRVVGVTDWCIHPADALRSVPRVGGTKNPRIRDILRLQPDLVIANHEENRKIDVERLSSSGVPVWVSYPRTVSEGIRLIEELVYLGADGACVRDITEPMRSLVERVQNSYSEENRVRVFCAIWKNPWITVGQDTFIHDILVTCGGINVCDAPLEDRYPHLPLEKLTEYAPEVILLPDEPYPFTDADVMELSRLSIPASANNRIYTMDGTLLSWYGPRITPGVRTVAALLHGEIE